MSLFLDASAIVAVLAKEPESGWFDHFIAMEPDRLTSAISRWEASRGLEKARGIQFEEACEIVSAFLREFKVQIVAIGDAEGALAIEAHRRFDKGRHPASLNLGDCFAYACSSLHADAMLFKGDDFIHTDIVDATLS